MSRCNSTDKQNDQHQQQQQQQQPLAASTLRPEAAVFHVASQHEITGVLLKTAVATVRSETIQTDTDILSDEDALRSLITEDLASKLN